MPVQAEGEPKPIERAVRPPGGGFRVGDRCYVEFGPTWATVGERQIRVDGQWFQCEILRHEGATVHVRLLPDVWLSSSVFSDADQRLCRCDEGWVCEDHPSHAINHDGCDGAGLRCLNPNCARWQGSAPKALNTDDWEIKASIGENPEKKKPN